MKTKQLVISALMITSLTAFSDPFSSEWNWEGIQLRGKVKTITTPTQVESFNESGRKMLSKMFNKEGILLYETTLEYNDAGALWKVIFKKTGGDAPMYTETATYTSKGILKSVRREGRKGDEGSTDKIGYDARGHLELISTKAGSKVMAWQYHFSEKGHLQTVQMLVDGIVKSETVYTPNTKGDPGKTESSRNGKPSHIVESEYQYDAHGNWTSRTQKITVYRGDKVVQQEPRTETRTIEYY